MSQGRLRKKWLKENESFLMTRLSQPQLPRRGTIWSPSCSRVKATSEVFSSRNISHRAIPIESSEINSPSYPRLPIDANQIKWFKIHILFLDFDWCPIEVMLTLHFKWTSIGSLGWIAWRPCKASILRRGWVEKKYSLPSWFELRIVPMAHRVTHPLSFWGYEHSWVGLSRDQTTHSMSMKFYSDSLQKPCSSLISLRSSVVPSS